MSNTKKAKEALERITTSTETLKLAKLVSSIAHEFEIQCNDSRQTDTVRELKVLIHLLDKEITREFKYTEWPLFDALEDIIDFLSSHAGTCGDGELTGQLRAFIQLRKLIDKAHY